MENKKTIIGIIVVIILIIGLVVTAYLYNDFNTKQVKLLTEETNILLQADIITEEINLEIKTEKNYAIVEKSIKEYLLELKNIYEEIDSMGLEINPNDIFSAKNIEDKNFEEIDNIINEYKEKCKNYISEYKKMTEQEEISKNINEKVITNREEYYKELYYTVMLSDAMQEKYNILQTEIEEERDKIYDKLNKIERIKKYLEDNQRYWIIKDEKIQFTNISIMTEYYNLLNTLAD